MNLFLSSTFRLLRSKILTRSHLPGFFLGSIGQNLVMSIYHFSINHQKREAGLIAWLKPTMFILWVRGGAYFLHFAAGTDLSFYKLEEKREKAARWVTHRGSHSKPHIQVDSSVCFFYEGFKGGSPASSVRSILPGSLWPLSLCTCCVLCLQHQASLPLGLACMSLQPSACRDVPFGLAPVPLAPCTSADVFLHTS